MRVTLLTVEQAAETLHETVTVASVRRAIRSGALPARKIGKRWYVTPEALERFASCPDRASPPASTSAPTPASGSFATGRSPSAQALAMASVHRLKQL